MEFLCSLPPEISLHILTFLRPCCLKYLFGLDTIFNDCHQDSEYDEIRKMALYAMYENQNVSICAPNYMLNAVLDLNEPLLKYLQFHRLVIRPKQISIFLLLPFVETSTKKIAEYMDCLQRFTNVFNIHILTTCCILTDEDNIINGFLQQFKKLNSFSIDQISHMPQQKPCQFLALVPATHLTLLYHNAEATMVQLGAFNTSTIKHLDISFNGLTDYNLHRIQFPELLESLNLSNNNIFHLSSSTLNLQNLPNLKKLDLSNNNLMSISISQATCQITHFNVSGNNLTSLEWIMAPAFSHLKSIDLAHNMIATIAKFPSKVEYINLCGNFLHNAWADILNGLLPPSLVLLNALHCRIDTSTIPDDIVGLTKLYNLKALYFSGFTFLAQSIE